jgi:mRNA-degrading endonuclease toxin of MazEF toxin-antitoxin module
MKKDFEKWHGKKEKIHESNSRVFFDVGQIWFAYIGANIGFEQDGSGEDFLRPVLVVRKFNNEVFLGVPLTRTDRRSIHYFVISEEESESSVAILSQIRLFDAKRLRYPAGTLGKEQFHLLVEALLALIGKKIEK